MRWVAAGVALVLIALALRENATQPAAETAQYCELVALNRRNAELGWPDFNNNFADICNDDGTAKEQN